MKYTIENFNSQFPTDESCLDYLFKRRYPEYSDFKKIKGRMGYMNRLGKQVYPLKGTILEKTNTSLRLWFFSMYLFSQSRNGVSGKELQRQLGVTYKTAWRMANRIRKLMYQQGKKFSGVVECDEAYIGGKRRLAVQGHYTRNKTPILGIVQRGGGVHAQPMEGLDSESLFRVIRKRVRKGSKIVTDSFASYKPIKHEGYTHRYVNHSKWEYVRQEADLKVHTNTIEGFWSQLKGGINGTYKFVSRQHLDSYVNEACFRYNHKGEHLFPLLLERLQQN